MQRMALKYRITATLLSALMLISSTGVAMDMHYCQDILKSVRLIGEAPTCHDQEAKEKMPACHKKAIQKAEKQCHKNDSTSEEEECQNDCCSHEVIHAQLDADYLKSEQNQLEYNPQLTQVFLSTFILIYQSNSELVKDHFLNYKPPLPDKDIPVLIQSFQI